MNLINRAEKITESIVEREYIIETQAWISEPTFLDNAKIQQQFVWWPKRCRLSQRRIWLEYAVRARITMYSQRGVVYDDRYYAAKEFTMYQLKGINHEVF